MEDNQPEVQGHDVYNNGQQIEQEISQSGYDETSLETGSVVGAEGGGLGNSQTGKSDLIYKIGIFLFVISMVLAVVFYFL